MTTHHQSPDELSAFADLIRDEQEFLDHRDGVDRKRRRSRILRGLFIVATVIAVVLAGIGA